MGHDWTKAQLSAITTSGKDLLVSAGAGSGKTAVLTERIIRRLTDEENPADITRMLIVTFTKAAAGELKERISAALSDALAKQPKNRRLARQLLALDRAKICTIHSFCLDLLRDGIGDNDLPTDFRIADETEITLLRKNIMNDLIDDYYSVGVRDYPIDNFEDFADIFVGTKNDDTLADIFLDIENRLSSYTEYIDFIKTFADGLESDKRDFSKTECGSEILDIIKGKFIYYRKIFAELLSEITGDEKLTNAYFPAFSDDIDFIDRALSACEQYSYGDISKLFNSFSPMRLGVVRNAELSESIQNAKESRKKFHAERGELTAKFFSLTDEQLTKNRLDTAHTLNKLYTLLSAFNLRFSEEKRKRSLVDFSDLERMAYSALVQNGAPTDAAKNISKAFDEIYIDEYQDVNSVQDAIFAAVSRGNNRFMVGDIKQSIYGFRGSEPKIFADYRRKFTSIDDSDSENGAAIFLSNNFRCDNSIIDFSNIVSACLFTSGRGDIPFTNDDKLIHSKVDTESGEPVHVVLIDGNEDESDDDVSSREAEYIASEISRILKEEKKNDGSPIKPSDIAVIMRSTKAHSAALEGAFDKYGIPYYNNIGGSFFENAEVLLALCILNIIDNPTRDIYLAGALRSPVFAFGLDELITIRKASPDGSLYDALRNYCKVNDFSKGSIFLATLERWQKKAEGMPVDRLLWYIYTDTDLPALVYDKENEVRRANLMLLYEYARRFESSSFKGLYNFIRYVNDILEEKEELENAKIFGESSDTVKFMTIHQSKGLEFPVCFICGTGKKFNESDLRANVVIERSLGIALKLTDSTGFARYDTPIRQALVKRLAETQLEEEMRVLYVAMTRARERLYVTALCKDPQKMLDTAAKNAENLSRYTIMKPDGYMSWILTSLAHHSLTGDTPAPVIIETVTPSVSDDTEQSENEASVTDSANAGDELLSLVKERFDFVYPGAAASKLPAKLSVSKLTPTILDEGAAELEDEYEPYSFEAKRPLFLDENAAPSATGAERGTATHLFMQFCDFSRFSVPADDLAEIIEDEASRLANEKFITGRAASLINVRGIARFFVGETFKEITASPKVWREHRFNVKLPASDFTSDASLANELRDESILVQGVIDCFYENPDGTLTIIDYKTDYIPPELDGSEAEVMLLERHRLQLSYYKAACEKVSSRRVSRVAIYSFALGYAIDVI